MTAAKDYQQILTVAQPPAVVYGALTAHIADWWSRDFKGDAALPGSSFDIAFGQTRKTFRITEAIPGQSIVWECLQAHIAHPALSDKAEWVGTKISWCLSAEETGTVIRFRHEGLQPRLECYEICEAGWDHFLGSLKAYIDTGKGVPYERPAPQQA